MPTIPLIIAHRGASHAAPENTLASIALGWKEHADGAEIDIHLTADGHIVAIHDATLQRTAGLAAAVVQTPLAMIQSLDAGSWKAAVYRGEPVPALAAILAAVPAGKKLLIEIKGQYPGMVPALAEALRQSPMPLADVVLIDFNAQQLHQAKAALPDAAALHLAGWEPEHGEPLEALDKLIRQAASLQFDGLNLSTSWPWDKVMVQRIHDAGLSCWVWTVNDEALALHLAQCGVDGITSDRPGAIHAHLTSQATTPSQD